MAYKAENLTANVWGAGEHHDIITASIKGLISALNRIKPFGAGRAPRPHVEGRVRFLGTNASNAPRRMHRPSTLIYHCHQPSCWDSMGMTMTQKICGARRARFRSARSADFEANIDLALQR